MKFFRTLSFALAIASLPIIAIAETGRIVKDSKGAVTVYGLAPNSSATIGLGSIPKRQIRANSCGLVVIKPSTLYPAGTVQVDGVAVDPATLPVNTLPTCKNGSLLEPRPAAFKTSKNAIALTGKSPSQAYVVSYPNLTATQNRKANTCGLLRLTSVTLGQVLHLPTTTGSLAAFANTNLPVFAPPTCYRGKLYVPPNWPPPLAQSIAGATTTASNTTTTGGSTSGGSTATNSGGSTGSSGGSAGGGTPTPITLTGVSKITNGTVIIPNLQTTVSDSGFRLEWFTADNKFINYRMLSAPNACGFSTASSANAAKYYVYEVWDGDYRVVWSGDTLGMPIISATKIGCLDGQPVGYN